MKKYGAKGACALRWSWFVLIAASTWCSTWTAHGQEADAGTPPREAAPAPEAESVPEILVVGTPLAQTAGSGHVIDERQLNRWKRDDIHAVLSTVPGIYVRGEDGVGLRPNIGLRGVNPDRSKKVTLMEDGVLFGPAPYSAPAAYYFPLVTRMREVRVIKGPAAVSYGPQTVAGAIDLLTREIPAQLQTGVDLAFGEYGYDKVDGYFGGREGKLGFLVQGLHLGNTGWKQLPDGSDTGFFRNEWMVKTAYELDPHNELQLKLTYSDETSNETYLGLSDADFRENPLQRYGASKLDRMRNHRTSIVATHFLTPSDDVSITTDVYRHDYARIWRKVNHFRGAELFDVLTEPDNPRNEIFHSLLAEESDASSPQETLFIGPNERDFVSQGVQSRLQWETESGPLLHRVEGGLRLHNDRIDRRHSEDGFAITAGDLVPDGGATVVTAFNAAWTYAFAANASDAITWGPVTLTPGLRFELIRSGLDDALEGENTRRWAHAVLPGTGVFVALHPDFGLLAGVHRGFSPPAPGSDDSIAPELSWNYEAGARYSHKQARAELIGFYNDYSNLTDVCTLSSGCSDANLDQQFDAGKARIYGLEALAQYDLPVGAFTLPAQVAYTLTRAQFSTDFQSEDPIFGDVRDGDEIPYVPRHQLSAMLGLEHARAGGDVMLNYVARMREVAGDEPLSETLATDPQLTLDVSVRVYLLPWLELYGNVRNLLNAHDLVARRPYGAKPNAPRWIQVGVKLDY